MIIGYNFIGEIQLVLKPEIDRKVEIVFNFSIDQEIFTDRQISLLFNQSACPN